MQIKLNKISAFALAGVGLVSGIAATIGLQTHAASTASTTQTAGQKFGDHQFTPPAAAGQVTAVSGNTITLNDKRSGTTYNVDASTATIEKFTIPNNQTPGTRPGPQTITASQIAVGDNIMVQGTISGTTITATKIMDGMGMMGGRGMMGKGHMGNMGTVTTINGNTITLTTADGKTVTVDGSSATVQKLNTINLSDIQIGDSLMVHGQELSGTISATNIVDGQMPKPQNPVAQ